MPSPKRSRHRNPWSSLTRREFLAAGSLGVLGILSADEFGSIAISSRHAFRVRRDRDLLDLEIEFVNFREVGGRWLQSAPAGQSRVIVHFPPQNLAEAIFDEMHTQNDFEVDLLDPCAKVHIYDTKTAKFVDEKNENANSPKPPVRSYMSGPSRIVFVVPEGVMLPFTRTASDDAVDVWLQKMAEWQLYVPPEFGQKTYKPRPPRWDETSLELPYRLIIAPRTGCVRWLSSAERLPFSVPTPGICELWNAQLISRVKLEPAKLPPTKGQSIVAIDPNLAPLTDVSLQAKALYSPDYRENGEPGFIQFYPGNQELSLHSLTRHRLTKQMSEGQGWIDIDHLVLTALGSDAFLAYFNPKSFTTIIQDQLSKPTKEGIGTLKDQEKKENDLKQPGTELMVWKHRMVVGRDVYFVEAYFGVLFPMVYPSLYIELTQRKFAARKHVDPKTMIGPPGAYLLKRRYIVVVEPSKYFTGSDNALGRSMPIKSAVLGMTKSPDLHRPDQFPLAGDLDQPSKMGSYGIPEKPEDRPLIFLPRPINEPGTPPNPVEWPITFTDESGRTVRTPHATMLFASNVILGQRVWDHLKPKWRDWVVPPQPLALAPEVATLPIGDKPAPDKDPSSYDLAPSERDGIALLGEGIQKWHQLARLNGKIDLKALLNEHFRVDNLQKLQKYHATLEAAFRTLPTVWTGTDKELENLYKKFPFQKLGENREREILDAIKEEGGKIRGGVVGALSQIQKTADQLESSLQNIKETTMKKLSTTITTLTGPIKKVEETFSDLHEKMREVEKISSILETHKITLGSAITNEYFKDQGYVDKLREAGIETDKDAATKLDKVCRDIIDELKKREKKEQTEFESLRKLIDRDRKAIGEAGKEANRLAQRYVSDLIAAKAKAEKLGANQFHAVMEQVEGIVPSMKAMIPNYPIKKYIHLADYVAKGINEVENGIFAQLAQDEADLKALVEKPVGALKNGLATPRALIQGLSNRLGAVAAENLTRLKELAHPEKIDKALDNFKNAIPNSKLFGAIELQQLIGKLTKGQLPSINLIKTPEKLTHTWKATLPIDDDQGNGKSFFGILTYKNVKLNVPSIQVCLNINIVTTTNLPKPEQAANGERPIGKVRLDAYMGFWDTRSDVASPPSEGTDPQKNASFSLTLLGMIEISFRQVRIEAEYLVGETPKPRIKPEIVKVDFLGPLQFVNKLQSFLGNLGGGFRLSLTPKFLELSYGFLIPPISFGAFSLRNILLQSGLMLPFADDPLRFSFNVSSYAVPFELIVMCFGGRGFLRVEIDTRGGRSLEGALEFGGSLAFDVGVASGGLYVMAGIYFKITQSQTSLGGYLRAGGNLNVLGLIHVNVEFLLMMTYRSTNEGSELYGTATLTINIEILFFSITVHVTLEKRIAGSKKEGSTGGTAQAMAPREGSLLPLTLILLQSSATPAEPDPPRALDRTYFQRSDFPSTPGSTDEALKGRFPWDDSQPRQSARCWVRDYWSQFDLTPN